MNLRYYSLAVIFLSCIGFSVILIIGSFLSAPHPSIVGSIPMSVPAKNVKFESQNGNLLSGWYIPGEDKRAGILLMHGIKSNRLQMLERAKFLNKAGYSVLLFDFQGHGESEGDQVTFGYLEAQDADSGFTFLQNQLTNKSIGVIGVSLGGAAAILSSVLTKADALILESVFPTIEEAVSNRLTMRFGYIGRYFSPLLLWQIKPRLGFDPKRLRPIEHISRATGAIFIIAGTNDKHTTILESRRLFQSQKSSGQYQVQHMLTSINLSQMNIKIRC